MARNLFEAPIDEWEYADVDAFLHARIPENSTVEYKAAAQTTPVVPLEAAQFEDDSGRKVVVVRVRPGSHPPYFGKGDGVRIRSGDQDVHADPRTLEHLFARRGDLTSQRDTHKRELVDRAGELGSQTMNPFVLAIRVAPLAPGHLPFDSSSSQAIRRLIAEHMSFLESTEKRSSGFVEFGQPGGSERLWIREDGAVDYVCLVDDPPEQRAPISVRLIFERAWGALRVGKAIQATIVGSPGPFFTGLYFGGLHGRGVDWPRDQAHRTSFDDLETWGYQQLATSAREPSLPLVRDAVKSLAWRLGYNGHEEFIDRWGSAIDESTT